MTASGNSDKVTMEQSQEQVREGGSHVSFWRKCMPGRENSMCKGPKAGKSLPCSRIPVCLRKENEG